MTWFKNFKKNTAGLGVQLFAVGTSAEDSTGALTVTVKVNYDGTARADDLIVTEGCLVTLIK